MEIHLAGYNVDLNLLNSYGLPDRDLLTPEIFSAAYARISRSRKSVTELRQVAREDVAKARKSNRNIIFGMGHHSVAEHAVFNFDIIGVSRLALEEIEKFRLVSYTEKSQRYVTLDGDFILPREIQDESDREAFRCIVEKQNQFYHRAYERLKDAIFKKYPNVESKTERTKLEGWAKEDARYILSLGTQGQVGMTINARNLEHLFRRFSLSQYTEVREIGKQLYQQVKDIAPSIILFPEPSEFEQKINTPYGNILPDIPAYSDTSISDYRLIDWTENADERVLTAIYASEKGIPFEHAGESVGNLTDSEKKNIFLQLFENMEFFDSPPREFEMVDISFEAVISASNFAQLKRHRIATLLTSAYDLANGTTIPESIVSNGLAEEFNTIIHQTDNLYRQFKPKYGPAADYILTNAHRRRIFMKMNLRALYHFIRLREDHHTQWDIRNLATWLGQTVKQKMPLSAMLLCGKSEYPKNYESIYQKAPKTLI